MMYHARTLPVIMLTSPLGTFLEAKWADDERGFDKSVQRDKYPLIHGETGIDFGGGADAYDITLIFDGPDCDTTSSRFFECAKEIGTWWVVHPVHGMIELQLLSLRQRVTPVSSGGRFEVETHWIEPLDPLTMMTMRQLTGAIDAQLAAVSAASASAFAGAPISGFGSIGAAVGVVNAASAIANKVAAEMYYAGTVAASVAIAKEQTGASADELATATLAAMSNPADFDPTTIATATHAMMQGQALTGADPQTAIRLMGSAVEQFAEMVPTTITSSDLNRACSVEMTLEAALGAACLATTISGLQTRAQAIDAARSLVAMLDDVTTTIDEMLDLFADNLRPERRYYGQTETYEKLRDLVASCVAYLIQQSFDLRVEKRVILDRDKTPIQICVEEYGVRAEDYLDQFIDWNSLEGDEVMLVSRGDEVVVYVETKRAA